MPEKPASPDRAEAARLASAAARLAEAGDRGGAIRLLSDAVLLAPEDAGLRHRLGVLQAEAGLAADAVLSLLAAIARKPTGDSVHALAALLRRITLPELPNEAAAALAQAFAVPGVDHQALVGQAVMVLKRALLPALRLGRAGDWAAAAAWLLGAGRGIAQNPLFRALLTQAINTDAELECLLTAARRRLALEQEPDRKLLPLLLELAEQAWNNRWVWSETAPEQARIDRLEQELPRSLAGPAGLVQDWSIALLASYRALDRIGEPGLLLRRTAGSQSPPLKALLQRTLAARLEEQRLMLRIERLHGVPADAASRAVQAQYEADPYPRWLAPVVSPPGLEERRLAGHFSAAELAILQAGPSILVAGCGTGRHAIEAALRFGPAAAVTGLDLSAASLAYGLRMARRFGVANVRFLQGDILELDRLTERFAVIEAVGVLHHLQDPAAGLAALLRRLQPGGLLKLGLYSRTGRQGLAEARAALRAGGASADAAGIRALRARVLAARTEPWAQAVLQAWDFYVLSDCRDLLLHVQERDYDLSEIAALLHGAGLEFRGFTLHGSVLQAFQRREPRASPLDLAAWARFEAAAPGTFAGMYRFWCRVAAGL